MWPGADTILPEVWPTGPITGFVAEIAAGGVCGSPGIGDIPAGGTFPVGPGDFPV